MISIHSIIAMIFALFATSHGFDIHPKILNGIESEAGAFPFFVLIQQGSTTCGGSVLSDRWIVTAAHCILGAENIDVILGFQSVDNFDGGVSLEISNRHIHPSYNRSTYSHDIALLKLPERTTLGPNAKVVKLPTDGQSSPYKGEEPVIVIGAGEYRLEGSELVVPLLRHAFSLTISSEDCARRLIRTSLEQSTVLCMKVINGQSGYNGDSGGPIIRTADGALIGVADFISQDFTQLDPRKRVHLQIAARVEYYLEWIAEVTGLERTDMSK